MKKKFLFATVALVALASCSTDEFIGENTNSPDSPNSGAIVFGLGVNGATRADMYGSAAAEMLGNHFYVTGTKGTEGTANPTENLVIDNYLVEYTSNTAGTTESNTANWEYVGITPDGTNYAKLSSLNSQTIKYWDYSADQYDFLAFSPGKYKAVSSTTPAAGQIGVTAMKYGADLATVSAYTFTLPDANALKEAYISDITTVEKTNYGKEVTLKFKNLGSKVRIALYETVPGYAVTGVKFYAVDGTKNFTDANKNTTAKLISASGIPTSGTIEVYFPHVGTVNRDATPKPADYNIAAANVTVATGSTPETSPSFGDLDNYATTYEGDLTSGSYIGRTLPTATFAGTAAADYYQTVFPVSTSAPLTLRVDYTLVSTDGSGETINIYGAKAVVPSTYTKWLPNYAYTYIFKISDNTNGWTDEAGTKEGLFPITFDAVVAEATDATGEQATITTVATPTITTYQQNHDITKDEYSKTTAKNIYVQVMDNNNVPATLKGDLNGTTEDATPTRRSLLYALTSSGKTYSSQPAGWPFGYYTDAAFTTAASGTFSSSTTYYKLCTEADVMDALENQSSVASGVITGRNGMILTPNNTNIDATVTSIVNGPDDHPITVTAGQAAEIAYTLDAGTYAYVYDYSDAAKVTTIIYQPIAVAAGATIASGAKYVTTTVLNGVTATTTADEAVDKTYIYFSKTTNGTGTATYSYVSVDGKKTLPAGLVKCPVTSLLPGDGTVTVETGTIVFTTYERNDGKYAVKVIRIVD